jgi:acetyl-CoA C-acetyltransferase
MVKTWGVSAAPTRISSRSRAIKKAIAAYARAFTRFGAGLPRLEQDDNIRATRAWRCSPSCRRYSTPPGNGTLTAGNSTPMTDGAAAVLLAPRTGRRTQPAGARVPALRQGRRRGFRRQEGGPVDGAGVRGPRCSATPTCRCRNSISTRSTSFRRPGAVHAQSLVRSDLLPRQAGQRTALGTNRPQRSSTSRAEASRSAIRSRRAARGSRDARQDARRIQGQRGLISICTAGGMGVTAIVER